MKERELSLKSNKIELTVRPDIGGSITSFNYKKNGKAVKILRTAKEELMKKEGGMGASCFAMLPYTSRIRDGAFIYWGIRRKVSPNSGSCPDPINGDGWKTSWKVENSSDSKVVMSYEHNGEEGFPYDYKAIQTVEVKNSTVKFILEVINTSELPMPCGIGLLPYFTKTDDVWVKCKNRMVWAHENLPPISKPYKTPKEWNFEEGRPLDDIELDSCFGGFDGKVEIRYPKNELKVNVEAGEGFNHVIFHSPLGENFFCVEPTSNATDAFNLAARGIIGSGIQTLEPKESFSGTIEITISDE